MTTRSAWAEPNVSRTTGKRIGWTARWQVPDGTVNYRTGPRRGERFATKRAAEEYAEDQVASQRRGLYVPPSSGRMRLADVSVPWLAIYERHNRPATWRRYEWALRTVILPEFGQVALEELDGTAMRHWLDALHSRYSERTIKDGIRSVLGNLLDYCVDERLLAVNPLRRARVHKRNAPTALDRETVVIPAWEEIVAMRAALPANMRPIVDLCADAGLRPGEARGLRVESVDFLRRQLHVVSALDEDGDSRAPTKNRSSMRTVPVDDDLLELLAEHLRVHGPGPDGLLLADQAGGPCHDHTVNHHWRKAKAMTGCEFRVHDLRHYYASTLIAAGVQLALVAKYLGHSSSKTTERYYLHLVPSGDDLVRSALKSSRHYRGIAGSAGR